MPADVYMADYKAGQKASSIVKDLIQTRMPKGGSFDQVLRFAYTTPSYLHLIVLSRLPSAFRPSMLSYKISCVCPMPMEAAHYLSGCNHQVVILK